ncbi:MAG: glycoside hydrolase family 3 C-terminal domain-containing protein [Prevotellaceae bacterium]|jgi:beta-glucosidase|nr:glycoside hydrolase family 3 C-terminal domain-containing protein [Prevotellaceae bacterium]
MKKIFILSLIAGCLCAACEQQTPRYLDTTVSIDNRVEDLLKRMTLAEKIGQLNQYSDDVSDSYPMLRNDYYVQEIKEGKVGSLLNITGGTKRVREYQNLAMQSRLKIPLLIGLDVVHGYKTTFPTPLAEAASWDLDAIKLSARIAAVEASATGVNWTFAPMVDICRDPRWGRIMEGAGEDPYLASLIAVARVQGFQGDKADAVDGIMACAKHFAAYGAALAGRDYNSVDMSLRTLWDTYLPPFKAACEANVATFMNSFNDLNGIPATGSRYLQRDILKGQWKFQGFVVSDWGSIGEMITHGYAKNSKDASAKAILAGNDMDMESYGYIRFLDTLVTDDKIVDITVVDDAVRRVLRKKFEIGLFDDPYRYCDEEREKAALNNPEHAKAARSMAAKSIVLLKNDNNLLPLSKSTKTVGFIGPLVKEHKQNLGAWSIVDVFMSDVNCEEFIVSQWDGVRQRMDADSKLLYAKGCEIEGDDTSGFAEAIAVARQSDVVVLSIGESKLMTGEARSRSDISLPGVQEELVKAICATGKPVVVLINTGRPLIFNWVADNVPAILYTWWLGSQAGNAIADVLFGDVNPSAKLPLTFPRSVGQIPLYYNHFNTGRPGATDTDYVFKSGYMDVRTSPRFAFGHGLSYTDFQYADLKLSKKTMNSSEQITVSLNVTNTGKYAGEEVVQLYLRDRIGSVVRPVKELKDFKKIHLQAGETKLVEFVITNDKLCFYNDLLQYGSEAGEFDVMIGSSSEDIRLGDAFELK